MPYIGQSPATGEANSFKTLDDITSYTLTFDGSSASTVSVANDTITEREHRFVTGQRVTYNDGGGTAITGLSDGVYYIIVEDRHTFKLATSANNAASGTAINLTGLGVGASHTLNVAFDGVNTKFKATINNGTRADITSAPQLMLSINGVLQQPHNNTTTPATGYAVDHTSTIIFSAAPATGDQFFGNLVAESYSSFEISDNAVDNFTGDGSTTDFTLSKAPPNNESILVTIDGVVQYPDDTSAVRAYSVSENILSFVTAPGSAVEIQVRHIGFAGASSAGITGFYGRTGNAVLKSTDNIVFNNATASGTVQAANVTVTGDLTVNGTTTTLDTVLTEVDKLEVGANNTTVAVAVTQSGTGDILNLYDGSSEVFSVADGGAVSGVGSFTAASFHGDGSQLTGIDATQIQTGNTSVQTVDTGSDGHVKINTEGSERLRIESGGNIKYTVASGSNNGLALNDGSNDLFAFGTGGFSVNGGTATDGGIRAYNNLVFATGSSSSEKLRITSGGNVGIGSAIPTDILDIQTGSGDEVTKFKVKTAGRLELTRNHASAPYIKTLMGSGNPAIHLGDSSGDNTVIHGHGNSYFNGGSVGIGTANPARKVEIFDTAATVLQLNSTNSGGTSLRIQNSGTDKMYMGLAGDFIVGQGSNVTDSAIRASGALLFASGGGTERLRINSAGNIGIGTDDPDKQVHIEAAEPFVRLENTHAGSKRLDLRVEENDNHAYISAPQSGQNLNLYGRSAFTIATNSETTERFRITSDGKLGVNVTSPGCQTGGIHAVHDATEGTPSFTGGEVGIFQRNYNSAQGCEIGIIGGSNSSSRINFGDKDDADIGIISYSHNDNSMRFIASATERLRITSTGGVTIGSGNDDSSMSEFGSNTGGLTIDDAGASNTGLRLSHGNDDTYLVQAGNGNCYLSYYGTGNMIIGSGSSGTERLRISGNAAAVHVKGETALTGTTGNAKGLSIATAGGTSCPLYFGSETDSAQKSMYLNGYWIYLRGHQNEGIRFVFSQGSGNAPRSDQYQFKYNQATRPTGNTTWDGFSDRRAKENVQDVTSALDTICRLRPVTFDWTNDYADRMNMFNMDKSDPKSYNWFSVKENGYDEVRKNNNVGFIAQEFEEVFPKDITETEMELGNETITDFKTVNFDSLVPMLTKAVQELKAENDSLKARITALES